RDVAHVDTRADHDPSLAYGAQRERDQLAGGREDQRGIERGRRGLGGAPGPRGAEGAREGLTLLVARPREGVPLAAVRARDLGEDGRGGSEAVEAELPALSGQAQRAEADQARAQQRRGLQVGIARGDRETVARVRDGLLRVATVEVITGETRA